MGMAIKRIRHRGLKRLYEADNPKGLPAAQVKKIKRIMAALDAAADLAQVATMPGWDLHPLKGARQGEYGITVTGNWRITFRPEEDGFTDVSYEDYH
jgi:proteic killer suppression protein